MATEHFDIQPEDGWVEVTSAGVDFIRINHYPCNQPIFITTAVSAPADTVVGYRIGEEFYVDVPVTDNFYVRVGGPQQPNGTRVYVFSLLTAAP